MGTHTRPARLGKCKGYKPLIVGRLYCDRETEHPGSHRDDTEGVYWIHAAPALEYLEVGPPATEPGCSCRYPKHLTEPGCPVHGFAPGSSER